MVYRFDAEWNGEVIAEDRRPDLEPFFGLRYPASDIPAQARALYATNWMRIIPDATYTRVPLEPAANPLTGRPLDLSGAMLRSVSPVHLEYLANMGVISSMSVSLIDRGKLWGLIACHHYAGPHRPSYADRVAAEFLGRTASLLLHTKVTAAEQGDVVGTAQRLAQLAGAVGLNPRALIRGADRRRRHRPRPAARRRRGGADQRPAAAPRDDAAGRPGRAARPGAARRAGRPVTDAASARGARGRGPGRHRQRRARRRGGRRPRRLPRLVPAGDAARGHLGRQPVRVEDGDDGRRAAAEPPPVVRQLERDGARDLAAVARARGRRRAVAGRERHRRRAQPRRRGQPAGHRPCSARCCSRSCRRCPASRSRPGTCRVRTTSSAATGTTSSRCPAAGCRSCSGTSPVTGWPPPRSPPSSGTPCARTCCGRPGPAAALDGLNQVISALLPGEMATAVIAEFDPADRRGRRRQRRAPAGAARDAPGERST